MNEVAAEKNSTLIFPLPIELMRLVDTVRADVERQTRPDSSRSRRPRCGAGLAATALCSVVVIDKPLSSRHEGRRSSRDPDA